jgi:8-oxo-dGTP pyrophosphatase MutT (NUDIX family)
LEAQAWVNIIPITACRKIVLIRQYRHGIRDFTLELPGGIVEKGDTPKDAAHRELLEETGYNTTNMISLGAVHTNPAFMNNRCYTFLATDVEKVSKQELDAREDIVIELLPVEEIPGLIKKGVITHSLIVAAFYRYYFEYGLRQPVE